MDVVRLEKIKDKIIELRGEKVILDNDVAELYGVETRDVNKAVKNNPDKFSEGYIFELTKEELKDLRWKFSTTKFAMTRVLPKAFTERGLYMLATILKSERATETTIAIIEAFYKLRALQKTVKELTTKQNKEGQKSLMQKSGELMTEILDDALESDESETTIELNFAVLKFKHTMKKKQNKNKEKIN